MPQPPNNALPTVSTAMQLLVALWRLNKELDGLDWSQLRITENERAEARATWAAIVANLKDGLSQN